MKEFAGLRKGEFPKKGWAWRAIDREISQAQYEDFLRLKDRHLAHKKRELAGQKELWQETYSHMHSIRDEIRQATMPAAKTA